MGDGDETCVRVALRIRPRSAREVIDSCQSCTTVTPGQSQVWIGGTHAFTYDSVFDTDSDQGTIFTSLKYLVEGCIDGYNATIVAYGQTGSGKTYTMGTGFDVENLHTTEVSDSQGIIPRAVYYLFSLIEDRKRTAIENHQAPPDFKINAQFVELYNEEVYDLIGGEPKNFKKGNNGVKIHEDSSGSIYMVGVGTKAVLNADATMECLRTGALSRTTAATNMNDTSSRSHAIFTLHITQTRVGKGDDENDNVPELETLSGKFHFVDLAGSERLKRTGAVGDRQKEGISINCGLLALGNVISALGDKSKKASHVPYRDSKLTRLLQDSLGGNSRTLMIACVSPCDRDFVETLSTLKYANRAKNIRNKVTINQDKSSRILNMLRQEIVNLQMEVLELRQGRRAVTASGEDFETDTHHENVMLTRELESLRLRVHGLQETVDRLTASNASLQTEKVTACWASSDVDMGTIVNQYTLDIEELRAKLCESEATCDILRRRNSGLASASSPRVAMSSRPTTATSASASEISRETESVKHLLELANQEIINEKQLLEELYLKKDHSDDSDEEDLDGKLASITENISTKEKLLESLEASERRMIQVKAEYEQKLTCSANKIKHTEEERDAVLANHKTSSSASSKVKQVHQDYELKLAELQRDRKRLIDAQREHHRLNKQNINYERVIAKLKTDVESMKKMKVKLMNQMKEENLKWRESEAKKMKEIAHLKKDQRKKDIKIQSLESRDKMRDGVLKRRMEEVTALKKKQQMSKKVAGKVVKKFSPVKAKKRWGELKTNILKDVTMKHSVESLEREMLLQINNRTYIMAEIANLRANDNGDVNDTNDQLDTLNATLDYTEEQIADIQSSLIEAASSKDDADAVQMELVTSNLTQEECGYVLQKMYEHTVEQLAASSASTKRAATLEEDKKKLTNETAVLRELLLHMYSKNAADDPDLPPELAVHLQNVRDGKSIGFGVEPFPSTEALNMPANESRRQLNFGKHNGNGTSTESHIPYPMEKPMTRKARRLTSTTQELLGGLSAQMDAAGESSNIFLKPRVPAMNGNFTRSTSAKLPESRLDRRRDTYVVPDSSRFLNSIAETNGKTKPTRSSASQINAANTTIQSIATALPGDDLNTTFLVEPTPVTVTGITPPGSPNTMKRSMRDENVFQRLTSASNTEIPINAGLIKPVVANRGSRSPFQNTFVAEGHSKSVLSLVATDQKLFSGARDAAVKVWDLEAGMELNTYTGHPNQVSCVQYHEDTQILAAASSTYIKLYDIRVRNCIKTLTSSGRCIGDDVQLDPSNRVPQLNGEIPITAMAMLANNLYTNFGEKVRVWDMRKYASLSLLTTKHQSQIMCMAAGEWDDKRILVTGGKDHYVKIHDFGSYHNEAASSFALPGAVTHTLEPPHYDGLESLALSGSSLFSGSRDCLLKKWDLNKLELQCTTNNAHTSWITGLAMAPSTDEYLVSTSRDGSMKLWKSANIREVAKVDAHKTGISCMSVNSSTIFTGSNEGSIGFWKLRKLCDFLENNIAE